MNDASSTPESVAASLKAEEWTFVSHSLEGNAGYIQCNGQDIFPERISKRYAEFMIAAHEASVASLRVQLGAIVTLAKGLEVGQQELRPGSYGYSLAYALVAYMRRQLSERETELVKLREALALVLNCQYDDERLIKDVPAISAALALTSATAEELKDVRDLERNEEQ